MWASNNAAGITSFTGSPPQSLGELNKEAAPHEGRGPVSTIYKIISLTHSLLFINKSLLWWDVYLNLTRRSRQSSSLFAVDCWRVGFVLLCGLCFCIHLLTLYTLFTFIMTTISTIYSSVITILCDVRLKATVQSWLSDAGESDNRESRIIQKVFNWPSW